MLRLAEVGPGDVVYDLGCGDGRIVITAARAFGARGVGIDRDPQRIAEAAAAAGDVADRVSFVLGDVFDVDLRDGTVVCLYLQGFSYAEIRRRALLPQLKPGTRIVSHDFSFPDWPPARTEIFRSYLIRVSFVYVWTIE